MRNLDECTAEVFRRSEEKINKRKNKRTRILACCVPACLLVAVMFVMPKTPAADIVQPESVFENLPMQENNGSSAVQSLYICSGDRQIVLTHDPEAVRKAAEMLRSLWETHEVQIEDSPQSVPAGKDGVKYQYSYENQLFGSAVEYVYDISLTDDSGATKCYRICGNRLQDMENGEAVILSNSKLSELLNQLQLS